MRILHRPGGMMIRPSSSSSLKNSSTVATITKKRAFAEEEPAAAEKTAAVPGVLVNHTNERILIPPAPAIAINTVYSRNNGDEAEDDVRVTAVAEDRNCSNISSVSTATCGCSTSFNNDGYTVSRIDERRNPNLVQLPPSAEIQSQQHSGIKERPLAYPPRLVRTSSDNDNYCHPIIMSACDTHNHNRILLKGGLDDDDDEETSHEVDSRPQRLAAVTMLPPLSPKVPSLPAIMMMPMGRPLACPPRLVLSSGDTLHNNSNNNNIIMKGDEEEKSHGVDYRQQPLWRGAVVAPSLSPLQSLLSADNNNKRLERISESDSAVAAAVENPNQRMMMNNVNGDAVDNGTETLSRWRSPSPAAVVVIEDNWKE